MWLAVLLFIIILGLLIYLDTRKPKNYPPGPKWLPIVGSALAVLEARKRHGYLYKATAEMAKKYGPVIGLKVGKDLVVVVYGAQQIREFLSSDDLNGRPTGIFFRMRTWGKRLGVMLTDGELWKVQRRFTLRELREFGFGRKNMSSMLEDESAIMVDNIKNMMNNNDSVEIIMDKFFSLHVLNTMWMLLAGIRYSPNDKDLKNLQSILYKLLETVDMIGAPFSQYPILKYIAPELSGYKLYKETHSRIWEFLNNELNRHKETRDPNTPRDFMDVYLNILNSPEKGNTFSDKQLMAICLDFFVAGPDTTNKCLGFCFLYMLIYPKIQKKAQEEIDRVVGRNRPPSLTDRCNMPYIECIVLESLRMFAGRAFALPHRAVKDTYLNGYLIPKDTMVVANLHGTLMVPESGFDDSETFKPERFMKDGKVTIPETYIPFGFGKHRCMGETIARANLFLFISTLLQNFNFSIPPGCPPSTTDLVIGATPAPSTFTTLVTSRL